MLDLELPLFAEMAALVAFAAALGAVGAALRQPLVVSFLIAGLLAGPDVLGIAQSIEALHLLADFGIAVLLFLVGLKLDVRTVRTLGTVAAVTGLGQVFFTSVVGFLICVALGMSTVEAAYVAVALTFSSTIIIVKLLTDKREIDSLHGRIALGFLIVQDVVVVLAMVILAATGLPTSADLGASAGVSILRGVVIVVAVLVVFRPLAERATRRLARSPELLATAAIAWTLALSATGEWAGFGKELGGLLAGVTLGSTSARDAIASRLVGLRDFLLLFFFLALGATLDLQALSSRVPSALLLSLFVLIGNPLIVMVLMGWLGYRGRTGLLAGLTVAQISEFSLIFIAMGAQLGHVDRETVGLVTLVGMITITGSTYMILYSHRLHAMLGRFVRVFERATPHREAADDQGATSKPEVLVFGLGRYGGRIVRRLRAAGRTVLAVDFDPDVVRESRDEGIEAIYCDASDPAVLEQLPTDLAAIMIALPAIPAGTIEVDPRATLTRELRARGIQAPIAVTSGGDADATALHALGATITLHPHGDAAELAAARLLELLDGAGRTKA